ncbi:Uncharacterized protein ABC855_g4920 [[Candida] zeylanoides]
MVVCRESETSLLGCFVTGDPATSAPALIVHGHRSVGKSHTLGAFLAARPHIRTTVVHCDECVTRRVLLQRCLKRIREDSGVPADSYQQNVAYRGGESTNFGGVCENFENFIIAMEAFASETRYRGPHVLVLDRIDRCMEVADDLYAAFARLREQSSVQFLTTVFVISSAVPREVATAALPQVYFGAYSAAQALQVLQARPLCRFAAGRVPAAAAAHFWRQYTKIIVDLFFGYSGANMTTLIDICHELWPVFAAPVEQGRATAADFLRIYRDNRAHLLDDNVLSKSSVVPYAAATGASGGSLDLPTHSQFILMACYLASLVEPKNDLQLFSKLKTLRADVKGASPRKRHKVTRQSVDTRLLTPGTFELERMLAILSVIYRNESHSLDRHAVFAEHDDEWDKQLASFTLNGNIDVNSQLATLASLGLVVRSSSDVLSAQARWRCNLSWPTAEAIATGLQFPLRSYLEQ